MIWFYLLLILHILLGLLCAYLFKSTRFSARSWSNVGTVFGGLGFLLCWLCVTDWTRSTKNTRIVSVS
mgnify:CR=1 FL=1